MTKDDIASLAHGSTSRFELWAAFLDRIQARRAAEVGVFRGEFAAFVLDRCAAIERYYMIDPWRHLEDWNKPANRDDDTFEQMFYEVMDTTAAHKEKRVVLRGTTTEVADQIPDGSLDFAYVDADHTLRGITVDLQRVYSKVREGGWIGGDDFSPSIWQHRAQYEPTLVFPYAVHFAEGVGAPIHALPHGQFLMQKQAEDAFEFIDLTGRFGRLDLLAQLRSAGSAGVVDSARRTLGRALNRGRP